MVEKKSGMCRTLTAKANGADGVCDSGRRVHQEGLQAGPCPGCVSNKLDRTTQTRQITFLFRNRFKKAEEAVGDKKRQIFA